MHDLKYQKWGGRLFPATYTMPDQEALHRVANALFANIKRIDALAQLPTMLVGVSLTTGAINQFVTTTNQALGRPYNQLEHDALMQQTIKAPDYGKTILESIHKLLDSCLKGKNPDVHTGMDAVLSSIIILAFGAFENLATDLWEAAVNLRPDILATNILNSSTAKPRDQPERSGNAQEKMISLTELAENGFDVSKKMGTVLRKRKVVSFETFKGIKSAYEATFLEDGTKKKCPHLHKAFISDDAISMIQTIRNLLAHKGGVVDQRFRDAIKKHKGKLAALQIGDSIELDFEVTRAFVTVLFEASVTLTRYVDWWLNTHPK